MRIRCGYQIDYVCDHPTSLLLMLSVRPELRARLETPEALETAPFAPVHQYQDGFGNVCSRVSAPSGPIRLSSDFIIHDSGQPDRQSPHAAQHPVEELPDEVLGFLLGSRYCETDRLSDTAWAQFGSTPLGWARVQAIVEYTHKRITFGYPHARATRTAFEGHDEQVGVCRDFAHLAVTLCRCMNIPARYVTGYLGDIGVPAVDAVMDFSAWFEVYLGGEWHAFDARHNFPRIGRIPLAYGRDATDVAIATTFGATRLTGFKVICEELPDA